MAVRSGSLRRRSYGKNIRNLQKAYTEKKTHNKRKKGKPGKACARPHHIHTRKEKVTHPMREQLKRLISAAAAICLLPGMTAAPYSGVPCYALTVSAAAASAAQYGQSAAFAEAVQRIEEGACGLYTDRDGTLPEQPLAVGTALNKYQTYFVRTTNGGGWNGRQCYIYSQGVYSQLFDALPCNGQYDSESTRTVLQGPAEITPQVLSEHHVMPGAYLRTTVNEDGSFNGGAGHSLIILGYDAEQITVLEGNADGWGAITESTISYEEFAHRFTTGCKPTPRTVTHIIQPDESVYLARYGMCYSDLPEIPPAPAPEEPAGTEPEFSEPCTPDADHPAPSVIREYVPQTEPAVTAAETTAVTAAETTSAASVTEAVAVTAAATTVTAAAETAPETVAAVYQQPLTASEPALMMPPAYTAEPIRVSRKSTQIALFLPDARSFRWSSSDPAVAQVDETGKVTVRGNGNAVITASREETRYEFPVCAQLVSWTELGDINMDGSPDPGDANIALAMYVESLVGNTGRAALTEEQFARADVDDNGVISIEDAQNILLFYVEYTLSGNGKSPMETWAKLLNLE